MASGPHHPYHGLLLSQLLGWAEVDCYKLKFNAINKNISVWVSISYNFYIVVKGIHVHSYWPWLPALEQCNKDCAREKKMKFHIFDLRRMIWRYDWSSQLCTQLKLLWKWKESRPNWINSNPWPLWYQCSALPTELAGQLGAGYFVSL